MGTSARDDSEQFPREASARSEGAPDGRAGLCLLSRVPEAAQRGCCTPSPLGWGPVWAGLLALGPRGHQREPGRPVLLLRACRVLPPGRATLPRAWRLAPSRRHGPAGAGAGGLGGRGGRRAAEKTGSHRPGAAEAPWGVGSSWNGFPGPTSPLRFF